MAWTARQKQLVHQYARWAQLPVQEYRALLEQVSGCASSAHPALTQYHFDQFMARIETVLDYRVQEQIVPLPSAWRSRSYWRNRLPEDGQANSRQIHEIYDWWYKLQPYMPQDRRNAGYLRALAARACRVKWVGAITDLTGKQAGQVIEALKDRLRWALKDRSADLATDASEDASDQTLWHDDEADPAQIQQPSPEFVFEEIPF